VVDRANARRVELVDLPPALPRRADQAGLDAFVYLLHPPRTTFVSAASPAERALLKRHYRYRSDRLEQGRLRLSGPCLDGDGFKIVLIEAAEQREAAGMASADPAVREGLFRALLHPFRVSLWAGRLRA
jgi:uncharacterized protein YciI